MAISKSIAKVTIKGLSAYSQSRSHGVPKLEGENEDDHDERTWRMKLNTEERDGRKIIVIPAHGLQQSLISAARYSKKKVEGERGATWTSKFTSGIAFFENPALDVDPDTVTKETISANVDGVRGSGKRVPRRYPMIRGWTSTFEIHVLDQRIRPQVMREMLDIAGMFIGIGRFRPEKGGQNGRFEVVSLDWYDDRKPVAVKADAA